MQFNTHIDLPAHLLPPEYVRWANAQAPDDPPLERDDECPDISVLVEYEPGWFQPGKLSGPPEDCYPDEGEDPEILSVTIDEEDYEGPVSELSDVLPKEVYRKLVSEAWEDQRNSRDDFDDDYGYSRRRLYF